MNTKIDLHSNLPCAPTIPNIAIAQLKSFLTEKGIKCRAIHWQLLPPRLTGMFLPIIKEFTRYKKIYDPWMVLTVFLAKYLYEDTPLSPQYGPLIRSVSEGRPLHPQILKEFIDQHIEEKKLADVDVAGFTMKLSQWLVNYYILCRLKKLNPHIKTIIGGFPTSSECLEAMRIFKEADFGIWGEGETPLPRLIKAIDEGSSFQDVTNLIYRKEERYFINTEAPLCSLQDINDYPFPDYTDYSQRMKEFYPTLTFSSFFSQVPIEGVRGCPWNRCKFCVLSENKFYREKTPERILQEIEYQAQKYNTDSFIFVDTDITRKKREDFDKLLDLLLDSVKRRKKPYNIVAECNPLALNRKSVEKMVKISFTNIQIGFEAMTDSLLQKMRKKNTFAHNIQALKLGKEYDLNLEGLNIIRSIPDETETDVIESIRNLRYLRFLLDRYSLLLNRFRLFKGAPYFEEVPEQVREELWTDSPTWYEIKDLPLISRSNRWEWIGFSRNGLSHQALWTAFELLLNTYYYPNSYSYEWLEYPDGSSSVEERIKFPVALNEEEHGREREKRCVRRYLLNPLETEILMFCDTVKTYKDLKEHFKTLKENDLWQYLRSLRQGYILYYDDKLRGFISVLSAKDKKSI